MYYSLDELVNTNEYSDLDEQFSLVEDAYVMNSKFILLQS